MMLVKLASVMASNHTVTIVALSQQTFSGIGVGWGMDWLALQVCYAMA